MINPKRVATFGGSHGGYLTGMLIGSKEYKDLFSCAVLWNPCLNFNYMYACSDIPDWIRATILGKTLEYKISEEENRLIYHASPVSFVENVTTPSLFLIGAKDVRVPP